VSASVRKGDISLEGVEDSSKGSGATPAGVARATPRKLNRRKSLYSSASTRAKTRGLLSRVSIRGTPTNVHKRTHMQIEVLDSTPPPDTRLPKRAANHSLEHGKRVV